jgi:4-hydroxy-2-oxoglutarate aldolase
MRDFNLKGIMPPLTTPFDAEGEVDLTALARNIASYNEAGLAGYVALGSNGEAVHLTPDERMRVIETIKSNAARGITVIAGVNELSTRAAIESARQVADRGADAALVITPYFYKSRMTGEALTRFYTEVADRSPVPILIYNVPQNTGVVIEPSTIAALASHPNIIGVKDSAGNMAAIAETVRRAPADFSVLAGNGGILYPSILMKAVGAILAVACAAPRAAVDLYRAALAGDHDRARDLQNRIAPLSHAVTAAHGVAGLKAAMEMAGFAGGAARAPLAPVTPTEREKIRAIMRESRLFHELE